MNYNVTKKEGYVEAMDYRLFYRTFSPENPKGSVLCLHGGPGVPHDYTLSMADTCKFRLQGGVLRSARGGKI